MRSRVSCYRIGGSKRFPALTVSFCLPRTGALTPHAAYFILRPALDFACAHFESQFVDWKVVARVRRVPAVHFRVSDWLAGQCRAACSKFSGRYGIVETVSIAS